jgi:hypothetical protein
MGIKFFEDGPGILVVVPEIGRLRLFLEFLYAGSKFVNLKDTPGVSKAALSDPLCRIPLPYYFFFILK